MNLPSTYTSHWTLPLESDGVKYSTSPAPGPPPLRHPQARQVWVTNTRRHCLVMGLRARDTLGRRRLNRVLRELGGSSDHGGAQRHRAWAPAARPCGRVQSQEGGRGRMWLQGGPCGQSAQGLTQPGLYREAPGSLRERGVGYRVRFAFLGISPRTVWAGLRGLGRWRLTPRLNPQPPKLR